MTFTAILLLLLVKLTCLLTVAWGMHLALSRCNPRWRVWLWRSVVVGCGLIGTSGWVPPFVQLPVDWPESWNREALDKPTKSVSIPSTIAVVSPLPAFTMPESQSDAREEGRPPAETVRATDRMHATERITVTALPIGRWLLFIWGAGCVAASVGTLLGNWRLAIVRRRTASVPDWVSREATRVAQALGVTHIPPVAVSHDMQSPCLVGLWLPLILLPARQCDEQHREELAAILAHEMAHWRGNDLTWNALLNALTTLCWFHPLLWRVRAAHADACDAVADATAAQYIGDFRTYGQILARITLRIVGREPVAGLAMAHKSLVQKRIEALSRMANSQRIARGRVACAAFGVLAVLILLSGLGLASAPTTRQENLVVVTTNQPTESPVEADAPPVVPSSASGRAAVVGRAVDARGNAVPGIELRLIITPRPATGTNDNRFSWVAIEANRLGESKVVDQYLSAVSGSDGEFIFSDVLPRKFLQMVYWGSQVAKGRFLALAKTKPGVTQSVVLDVPTPAVVRGSFDVQQFPEVAGVTLTCRDDHSLQFHANTAADNNAFEFGKVPPGDYDIRLSGPQKPNPLQAGLFLVQMAASRALTVASGGEHIVDFTRDDSVQPLSTEALRSFMKRLDDAQKLDQAKN